MTKDQKADHPFWEDMPSGYIKGKNQKTPLYVVASMMKNVVYIFSAIIAILFLIEIQASSWFVLAYFFFILVMSIYSYLKKKTRYSQVEGIQQKAREITGASVIDSALVHHDFNIYSYLDSTPVSRIPLSEIKSVKLIVYDDERIPHSDIIDSAAQALELRFTFRESECTALFRKMINIRPIDWFHHISCTQFIDE